MASTPLGKLLGSSGALARLKDHAGRLMRLQKTVEASLPASMRGAVHVANVADERLVLHVTSPALAARLKMSLENLKHDLLAGGEVISEVQVKVRTSGPPTARTTGPVPERHIGNDGREALRRLSDELKADDPLALALKRMVQRSR